MVIFEHPEADTGRAHLHTACFGKSLSNFWPDGVLKYRFSLASGQKGFFMTRSKR